MEFVTKNHPKYTFIIQFFKTKNYIIMKNKVLRIFAIILIINFFACGTGKDSGQTKSDEFYLEDVTGAVEEEAMYEDGIKKERSKADYVDVPDGMPVPDEGDPNFNTEEYDKIVENEFLDAKSNPISTFSIDVDNAAYSNVRRMLNYNQMPDKGAVRIEEMINYFDYDYPDPTKKHPFSFNTEISNCPWNK